MKRFPFDEKIKDFASVFKQNGFCLYLVGGAVRDFLLKTENHDYDFCTDATPQQVISIFKSVVPTGIKHGTVTVLFKGEQYEVTTFRTETGYSDKRHPDQVSFVKDLAEDLSRRDFTVNAFAADCQSGKITDLFHGKRDLRRKIIRAIGNPRERFKEDALRLLRMCRFASKLSFRVDKETLKASEELSQTIGFVSQERIYDEMSKLLLSSDPKTGLILLKTTGLLKEILPELDACTQIKQSKVGSSDVNEHIVNSVQAAAEYDYSLTVRWALLLHDIGKAVCMTEENNFVHFHHHDTVSADLALEVMKRLKFSNKMQEDIYILIRNHMTKYTPSWTDGAVKRFINRIGYERINSLFELQWCDQIASEGKSKQDEYDEFIQRIEKCAIEPLQIKDLDVTGEDLNKIGIPKSKEMGQILEELLEIVLDNPKLNKKEILLEKAELIFQSKGN